MDKAFFQSREFVVAALVAGVVLVGGVVAVAATRDFESFSHHVPCRLPALGGSTLVPERADSGVGHENGRAIRTITYTLPAEGLAAGGLHVCTGVGDVRVGPSDDGAVHVTVTMSGLTDETVPADAVAAAFASSNGELSVAVAQVRAVEARALFHTEGASVDVTVELPDAGAWPLAVGTDVGDVSVADLLVADSEVSTDVGDVDLDRIDGGGDLTLSTDVGDVVLRLLSVASGKIHASTDVGDVDIALPDRPDVGYDASGSADVGNVDIDLGETERFVRDDEEHGPGGRVEARSAGYASKPTQVTVEVTTDVGDVGISMG